MQKINVEIEGVSPLLQHRFPMVEVGTEEKSKRRTGVPDWKLEVERSLYRDEENTIYQPATHIQATMKQAATNFKIPGRGKKTYKDLVTVAIQIVPDAIPHIHTDYAVDSRPVVIQKARVVRNRPRFDKWGLSFQILILDEQLSSDVIKEILDYAGRYVGIGDFRPNKGGSFGRFMVTSFKTVE